MMHRRLSIFVTLSFLATLMAIQTTHATAPRTDPRPHSVTFSHDVAPILYKNCTPCHHDGGPGPFPLVSYQQARDRARQIADVTARHFMPPWLPDRDVQFKEKRGLTAAEIELLRRWAAAGAPAGKAAEAPPAPQFSEGWQLGKPDLVLQAPAGYQTPRDGADVYHNFVFRVPITGIHYVRAVEIRPLNPRIVHHCNLLVDPKESARQRDGKNGVPGFDGMDADLENSVFQPSGHFVYWKPGSLPYFEPDNMTWELDPGTDLVLNMHLRPSGRPEPVRPEIALYFSPHAPTVKPMLMQLSRDDGLDIPPGAKNFELDDDFTLPVAVQVLAIYPHAHYLGHDLNAYATLPNGTRTALIHIRNWDPSWQGVFRYEHPVTLPPGTVISMRYTYDNSLDNPRNPNNPPKRVEAGNQSTDEMCHLWLQVIPATTGGHDGHRLLYDALMRHRMERFLNDYVANYRAGMLSLRSGNAAQAVGYFRRAVDASENPAALNGLAAALVADGRASEAIDVAKREIASDPNSASAHFVLASVLAAAGQFAESIQEFNWVIAHDPSEAEAEAGLGNVLAKAKDYDTAERHLRRALTLDPNNQTAQEGLKWLQRARDKK